ncbi:putative transmembrane protein TauE [Lupinus albus]|uniref:Putative transmembrane protein TauE n=1 Tax=Lupinus albus TaxID=3870 RepID=A0A6A4PF01_LUPAL|nr:putative transmembrane protein TauE [Lupinus albus]
MLGHKRKTRMLCFSGMIMGAALSTVYYNLKLRHPTLNMPIIDYDLALLIQPMLMLGISIGVIFNLVFPDWMVTILLIVLFFGTSTKAFFKGVETWQKETIMKKEAARRLESNGKLRNFLYVAEVEYRPIPSGPNNGIANDTVKHENHTANCSTTYWVLNLLQIPVSIGVSTYEAVSLYNGRRMISSIGNGGGNYSVFQLVIYCLLGVLAGIVGGLLGLGGGFIMGPLFLELGVPPQVSSATATFAMTFSSSMSVVEYYLLKRFPIPYAIYFTIVATIAAVVGQHIVRKLIILFGRASLIIFILAFTIFISAITLGGVGIVAMVKKIENHEYMGFDNLCKYG